MSLSPEKAAEFSEKGIRIHAKSPMIIGDLSFEPPITLNGCVIVGPTFIGRYSYVGNFTHIDENTMIGRYCSIASSCTIGAAKHPTDWLSTHPFQYHGGTEPKVTEISRPEVHTKIGNDVWIGANSVVLAGVQIMHGAIIGAGSVVTRDVAPYTIVVGAPARAVCFRFPVKIIRELLALEWWKLPESEIASLPFDDIGECLRQLNEKRAATA